MAGLSIHEPEPKPPKVKPEPRVVRTNKLDPRVVLWICSKAADFRTKDQPTYSWARIASNVRRAHGVILRGSAVARVVKKHDPELYAERAAAMKRRTRALRDYQTRRARCWLFRAGDRVLRGESEDDVLRSFGWSRDPA